MTTDLAPLPERPALLLAAATADSRPQAALELFELLCDLGTRYVHAGAWRDAASRLAAAAAVVPAAFVARYIDRAAECRRKASWIGMTSIVATAPAGTEPA